MYAERHTVSLTTNGSGAATGYTPVITGRILALRYIKTDFADGVDFDVTVESTGETVWDEDNVNASATRYPRAQTHTTAGVAMTYDGTRPVGEPVTVANDRLLVSVANGGASKTGSVVVIVG